MLGTLCTLITALTCKRFFSVLSHTIISHTNLSLMSFSLCVPGEAPQYVLRFHHSHSSLTETGDSAQYFCQAWDSTKLIVTSSSLSPPVLTVFPPSSAELQSNKASLVCLWIAAGSPVSSGISTSTAVQQPDQTFQISSYLSIQTSDWNMDKVYTCRVSLGSQTSEKTINKSHCSTEDQ
uniref:Ig-like domain-containing protein n=1 Tax=Labrus bergylta TaxID=56723 RepID=A0A3Q3FL78_9LABR